MCSLDGIVAAAARLSPSRRLLAAAALVAGAWPGAALAVPLRGIEANALMVSSRAGHLIADSSASGGQALLLSTRGTARATVHTIAARAVQITAASQCGRAAVLVLRVDRRFARRVTVRGRDWERHALVIRLHAGVHVVRIGVLPASSRRSRTCGTVKLDRVDFVPSRRSQGVLLGAAVRSPNVFTDDLYRSTWLGNFDSMTPENEMKMGLVEPQPGQFDFSAPDAMVALAAANGKQVRGHTLVYGNQQPYWVTTPLLPWTRDELLGVMHDYITTMMTRYAGRVKTWDVVNEAFNDDGSYRQNIWYDVIGSRYVEQAFRYARAADPSAKPVSASAPNWAGASTGPPANCYVNNGSPNNGSQGGTQGSPNTGDRNHRCPTGTPLPLSFSTSAMPEGAYNVNVSASDVVGNTATASVPIKIDRSPPVVSLSGPAYDAHNQMSASGTLALHVSATDTSATHATSGVASIQTYVDGQLASAGPATTQACSQGGCALAADGQINFDSFPVGAHAIEVRATDAAGNVAVSDWMVVTGPIGGQVTRSIADCWTGGTKPTMAYPTVYELGSVFDSLPLTDVSEGCNPDPKAVAAANSDNVPNSVPFVSLSFGSCQPDPGQKKAAAHRRCPSKCGRSALETRPRTPCRRVRTAGTSSWPIPTWPWTSLRRACFHRFGLRSRKSPGSCRCRYRPS